VRVLDFGLGWSEWANMARAFGCHVVGSELSPARIEYARSIGIEIVEWHEIPKQRFHFINTEQVFEHLVDPLDTLKHLASALEDEGLIKVSVPDAGRALKTLEKKRSFKALSLSEAMSITPLEHINCFEHHSLVAMAKNAGLRPFRPKLSTLYNSSSGWLNAKRFLKLALRPIYRHWYPKSTFVYFAKER
jgi:2-polyprenyl-3-methyl-5-hydroxy-6-metoxy-1,4-benzoquinol methylase